MTNPHHVYVQVWTENDPTLNVRVDRDSGDAVAEDGDELRRVSPLGRAALAAALAMKPVSVTAFSVGPDHFDALRHALAAGASQAIELTVASEVGVAGWLDDNKADLVIADRMAGLIAGRLGWAHLVGLDDLQFNDRRLQAVRHLGRGEREVVSARLPAVVRLQTESIRPPYISRARIQAVSADAVRCERFTGGELERVVEIGRLQPARRRTRIGPRAQPSSSRGADRLAALMLQPGFKQPSGVSQPSLTGSASAEEMAEEFVRYLLHHDLLTLRKEE